MDWVYLVNGLQQGGKQICVVGRPGPLEDAHQSLQSHPSIHADPGKGAQVLVWLPDTQTQTLDWDQQQVLDRFQIGFLSFRHLCR